LAPPFHNRVFAGDRGAHRARARSAHRRRDTARQAFGNVTKAQERHYEAGRHLWLDRLGQDLRAAARGLVRYPVVAAVAVLSLGAGIAATAASLTLRDVVFQNPPPLWRDPQRLSKIQVDRRDRPIRRAGSYVPGDLYQRWSQILGGRIGAGGRETVSDVRLADRVVYAGRSGTDRPG
jgi:hypothetical protein